MKVRWLALGIVVGLLLALTFGFAWGRGQGSMMGGPGTIGGSGMMDRSGMMDGSGGMGGSGMMTGSGGMGGSGMMTGSGHRFDLDDMRAMHDSPGMRAMHEQMPAAQQARCDELHEEMWS